MCGITGAFGVGDLEGAVRRMSSRLSHRGPDDSGQAALSDRRGRTLGFFAHRRLAILDLSPAGHQPMLSADSRFCLNYNGEIFNFPELKAELEREGAVFRSHCDTEAILIGWGLHGQSFLSRLRGMFAFSLWDAELARGYLARDAFGIKPLYVADTGNAVLFASEIRALIASGSIKRILSPEGLTSFLHTGSVAEPFTIVAGVRALVPGTVVEVRFDEDSARMGVAKVFAEAYPRADYEVTNMSQAAFQLRNALRDSVEHHLLSDVPVAMFLSGGLDSSAVVGIASEVSRTRLETFTVAFDEVEYSEGTLSRSVAERFGTNHHEVHLSGKALLEALPDAFGAMDQPSLDGLNTYIVSRAVSAYGIKVALSGLGGDELFGGYPSFRRAARISRLWKLPPAARRLSGHAARGIGGVRGEKIRSMIWSDSPGNGAYRASRMLFSDVQTSKLLGDNQPQPRWHWNASNVDMSHMSLLRRVSVEELTGYMRNTLLRDSDVFSMCHGLELRVPFLDPAVVRVAARAADSLKMNDGSAKPLLVKAVEDLIPRELLAGPKRGFTLPFESWMRADLSEELDAMFSARDAERAGISGSAARDVWESFQGTDGQVTWSRPWALYTLLRWARENDFTTSAAHHGGLLTRTAVLASV